ncbi:hypothetical protein NQ318_005738 [Aromia moschata]|uniref:Uncharacterized protein n=1 Tax=Aromia moschata TaxID=1265417 RepID=A0AAV8YRP4_9CUCU|nr:hypothetical protein NQ318_005738 [Aromia moschata]
MISNIYSDNKPVDVMAERLQDFIKEQNADTASIKVKLEEISPDVTEELSLTKRPSWLQADTIDKQDVCKFEIPHKPYVDKVSFYIEVVPKRAAIIRAKTCQTDPNFSKYKGRQGMGNAISALTMLRLNKSKVWVPHTLNTILKYGDLYYRDAMISIPRTQSLKLSNFQRKTEMEGQKFAPVVEDYVVVGQLQSKDYDVLDLFPALESYLVDHECCVIIGPITLAVWIEDGKFYMFDPNERDKNGKAIPHQTVVAGNVVPLDNPPGVACCMWFASLKDLADLYLSNVEKHMKMDPFYISKVSINDWVDIPDPWFNFKGLLPGKWILRGTRSQASKIFSEDSRNFQSPANSLIALALQILLSEKEWNTESIDEILTLGDTFYNESVENLRTKGKFINKMLMLSEVNTTFVMHDLEANFEVDECVINGIINSKPDNDIINLQKGFEYFFEDNDTGIVTSHNISVAIWKKDGVYYCFDGHIRDDKGLISGYGTACCVRTLDIEELAKSLEINLRPGKEDFYNISRVKIRFLETGGDVVRPPLNNYKKITDDRAILRSLYSEISTKYDLNCKKQTVPMCLVALAFNKLKPARDWTKTDLDEIMNKGDNLYVQTMDKIGREEEEQVAAYAAGAASPQVEGKEAPSAPAPSPPTDEGVSELMESPKAKDEDEVVVDPDGIVNTSNVLTEFNIGLNKMKIEFQDAAEGNIKSDLRVALQSFFEQEQTEDYFNQEAILESKPLSIALWRDDKTFYVFDSKPRDKTGVFIGKEDWSDDESLPPPPEEPAPPEEEEEEEIVDEEPENIVDDLAGGDFFQQEPETKEVEEAEEEGAGPTEITYYRVPKKSSSYWREQEKNGRAFTMWFTRLSELIDYVFDNIAPKLRKKNTFALKSVRIRNIADLKDMLRPEDARNDVYAGDWYFFTEIDRGRWIMRGTKNLMHPMFPEDNRGKQQIPASLVALGIVSTFSLLCFNEFSVDTILTYGDKLLSFVKRIRKRQLRENMEQKLNDDEIDWLVRHEEFGVGDITKKICISRFLIEVDVQPEVVTGDINAQNFEEIFDVKRGIERFFEDGRYGLLQCKNLTVAIWRGERIYYMFDGMNRGPNGVVSPNGTACITRYLQIESLSQVFLANLPKFGKNTFCIHKVEMKRDLCPREREPKEMVVKIPKQVETGGFHNVIPGKCIVRGTISQEDPKFEKEPNVLSAPVAVIALTMSLVHKADTWSRPIVDEIIEIGAELYEESKVAAGFDFNPWEQKMDVSMVKNDYMVGVLKANCELRTMDQKGIIDIKDPEILNLRQGIEKFFEENTHGIIVTDPLTLAIWEEEQEGAEALIYMFDPYPRGPTGMPLNTGTACVMTFVNARVAADHIIGCMLDPVQKLGEFTIVPVEIVVGNAKTTRKVTKCPTRSTINVLPRCSKLVADEQKRILRKIAENERRRKEAKRMQLLGRNGYYLMKSGGAIVRGYRSQNSDHYNGHSRNNQDIPNCIVALVMHSLFSVDNWAAKHVDQILDTGDQLYIDSYIAYAPRDKKLGPENIMRKFYLKVLEIHVTIYKPIVSDVFNVGTLSRILEVYFQQEAFCMLSFENQWVSIVFKSGYFYMFDPHERDIEGSPVKKGENGTAVVLRYDNLTSLSVKAVQNLYESCEEEREEQQEGEDEVKKFTLWLISVQMRQ